MRTTVKVARSRTDDLSVRHRRAIGSGGAERIGRTGRKLTHRLALVSTLGLSLAAFVPSMYLAVLAAAASQGSRKASGTSQDRSARLTRFVVCVPAHDEESIIRQTVLALQRAELRSAGRGDLRRGRQLHRRHRSGRRRGGHAGTRPHRPADPGKGAALNWLADRLTLESSDVVVVIDADTVAHPDFLSTLDEAFAAGAKVAQGHYGVQDPDTSPAVALRYAAIACRHHLRPLGRTNLGASSGLYGNGMAFRADVVWNRRWTNHLVEDAEFQMELLFDGFLVTYCSPMPWCGRRCRCPSLRRRATERWELGRLQLTRRYVPRLLAQACFGGRAPSAYLDAACDHLTPPLALQTVVNVATSPERELHCCSCGADLRQDALGGAGWDRVVCSARRTRVPAFSTSSRRRRACIGRFDRRRRRWSGNLGLLARIVRRPEHVTWTRTPRNEVVR